MPGDSPLQVGEEEGEAPGPGSLEQAVLLLTSLVEKKKVKDPLSSLYGSAGILMFPNGVPQFLELKIMEPPLFT